MKPLTLGERIKKVRRTADLTQQEFADRIGSKRNTVATYEIGRTDPSAAVISLVCREFNISEKWLRTGEGEMFVPTPKTSLDNLIAEFNLGELEKQIILEFVQLEEKDRRGVIEYVQRLAQNQVFQAAKPMTLEEEADQFAAMAREHFLSEKEQALQASSARESDVG